MAGSRGPTPNEDFKKVFDRLPGIKLEFDNYARGLMDLLLDNGDASELIGELAEILTGGETEGTIVQADQAQWDYHPQKRKKGIWYANFNTALMPERTFESYTQYMQDFVSIGGYGYDQLVASVDESGVPDRPTITYTGPLDFPKSELSFETGDFSDPQGANTFAAMQWRVAEVHNPSVANYDPRDRNIQEIEGTWQSDIITEFESGFNVPSDAVEVGKTYRARVRVQDTDGHWSHWSEPVEFLTTTAPPSDVAQFLRVSEVNYNPASNGDAEFIEFTNISSGAFATTLDLGGVTITDGPSDPFVFPAGTSLAAGGHVVAVRDLGQFQETYPAVSTSHIVGDYDGGLSNSGERIRVQDIGGNLIVDLNYSDGGLWSSWADGLGGSLVLDDPATVPMAEIGNPRHWRGSTEVGGSPAAANAPKLGVVVSEILAHTDLPQQDAIELYNETSEPIDISGWYLSDAGGNLVKFEIPPGTILNGGDTVVFTEADFNPTPLTPGPLDFALSGSQGDDVWLVAPNGGGGVGQFADEAHFGATFNGQTLGLTDSSNGQLTPLIHNGLGCFGGQSLVSDLYISMIHYMPSDPTPAELAIEPNLDNNDLEYLAVSGPLTSLAGWRIRGGIDFDFPESATTGNWIISFDPEDPANANKLEVFRAHHDLPEEFVLLGGYSGSLSNSGERLRLQRPDVPPLDNPDLTPYVTVDEVIYDVQGDWPAALAGESIVRLRSTFFGNDGRLWAHQSTASGHTFETGDFNGDGSVDTLDLDLLSAAANRGSGNVDYILDSTILEVTDAQVDFFVRQILDTIPGDSNLDLAVNATDLNRVGLHWQQNVCNGWQDGDFTGDGRVDAADLNVLGLNWQQTAGAQQAAVGRTPRAPLSATIRTPATQPVVVLRDVAEPESRAAALSDTAVQDESFDELRHFDRRRHQSMRRTRAVSPSVDVSHSETPIEAIDDAFADLRAWLG